MPNFRGIQEQVAKASRALADLDAVTAADASLAQGIERSLTKVQESQALQRLMTLPLDSMKDATEAPLRLEPLRRAGFTTVGTVYLASAAQLAALNGISPAGADELKSLASTMFRAAAEAANVVFDAKAPDAENVELLTNLRSLSAVRSTMRGRSAEMGPLADGLRSTLAEARPATSRLRWLFTGPRRKQAALHAVTQLGLRLTDATTAAAIVMAGQALAAVSALRSAPVLPDFQARSADYYAVLEEVTGRGPKLEHQHFDQALLDRIENAVLDTSPLRITLRRYQIFGSKFALAQRRVIIGDEMGLGKTLQALAVLAQRHAEGETRFLVVCPASVLVNWQREIEARSDLPVVKIHGDTQESGLALWLGEAGIGLTTYDTLKSFVLTDAEIDELKVDTVIIDEAHYVKNLETGRSKAVTRWLERAPGAVLLTGTPMENRVEEFITLSSLLDAEFAAGLNQAALAIGADAFRRQAAPLYLRRNTEDVLKELPALISSDEYCDWTGADHDSYVSAVAAGNFMGMRQAGMRPMSSGVTPNKLARLLEIAEDAFESGRKVLVFSYFRDVLDLVTQHLGPRALGPITGDVPPARRQQLVDEFSAASDPLALVGQIQAAGTGLNVQAASVVILCEPQIKPSLEAQAIGRAHRMGQLRTVQVHRLVIPQSVDDLMLQMLARKQQEFDEFVRVSELADSAGDAKDHTEESLARVILLEERRRLGLGAGGAAGPV